MIDTLITITERERAELLPEARSEAPLGPTEVAGPTVASLVSAGTELMYAYTGEKFPVMPGYAAVFRVTDVGAEVSKVKIGDHIFCLGSHRSFQRFPENEITRVPDHVPADKAVFARLMSVSMSTLTTTTARPPDRVIVAGLGPVGYLAAQIFRACGYQVLACDPVASRREWASSRGIQAVAGFPLDDPAWEGKTTLVLECSGHETAALDGCRVVSKRGEVVLLGVPWKRCTDMTAHELLHAVFHRYVILRSGWEWEVPRYPTDFQSGSIQENLATALRWIGEDKIPLDGLISIYTPQECQRAYQNLLRGQTQGLAAVFDWTQN